MSAWDVRIVDQDYAEIRIPSPLGLETFVVHAGVAHHLASRHNADVARPSLTQQQLEASAARVLAGAVRELLWGLAPSWLRKRRRA